MGQGYGGSSQGTGEPHGLLSAQQWPKPTPLRRQLLLAQVPHGRHRELLPQHPDPADGVVVHAVLPLPLLLADQVHLCLNSHHVVRFLRLILSKEVPSEGVSEVWCEMHCVKVVCYNGDALCYSDVAQYGPPSNFLGLIETI